MRGAGNKNRTVCFVFEGERAPRHLLLGKGQPVRKLYVSIGAFQGHQGNDQGAWRQSPLLPPLSIGHVKTCSSSHMYELALPVTQWNISQSLSGLLIMKSYCSNCVLSNVGRYRAAKVLKNQLKNHSLLNVVYSKQGSLQDF